MKYVIVLSILTLFLISGCTEEQIDSKTVNSFEECIEAGNPAMESYPRQCRAGDQTFTEEVEVCENQCGDNNCAEVVCSAIGCPCAETKKTCPEDCA